MTGKAKAINGATETIENMVKSSSDAMKQSFDRAAKGYDSLAAFNKATLEAFIQSANVATKGLETINAEALAYSKQALEDSVAAAKAAMTSKSIQELIEVQSDFAKSSFDTMVGQATKFGDLFMSVAKETAEPISGRTAALVELVQSSRIA
jgi:phasin family protein